MKTIPIVARDMGSTPRRANLYAIGKEISALAITTTIIANQNGQPHSLAAKPQK
jgi:hypothetical protein